jgi:hypothetical protein
MVSMKLYPLRSRPPGSRDRAHGEDRQVTLACRDCGQEKDASLFTADKRRPAGFGSYCKACFAAKTNRRRYPGREYIPQGDERRFWRFVTKTNSCWLWGGATNDRYGYGRCRFRGRVELAHRASYVISGKTIPTGMTLDHLCRNTRCVNPDHLEPVTVSENCRRAHRANNGISRNKTKKISQSH